ncbi:MAG: branched-chain amino acid ABC transporter substrate-binding protein [Desulfoferrobacter sp.]
MKKFLVFCFLMSCCFLGGYAFGEEYIKVGLLGPMTGPLADEGKQMKEVVELLAADLNAQGGVLGKKVQIITADDQGTVEGGITGAQELIDQGVVAAIGSYPSSVTAAAQNIFSKAGVLQITNASTAVPLSQKGIETFVRICSNDDDQAEAGAEVISERGYKKVAILHDDTLYSKGLANSTRALLEKKGMQIIFDEALPAGRDNYKEILIQIKKTNPDVIFFTGYYPEAGVLLRQKRELGWKVPIIGGDASNNPDLIKIAGKKAAKGFQFLSLPRPENLPSLEAKEFLLQYKNKYGHRVNSIYAMLAGDAFRVITFAIEQTKSTKGDVMANYLLNDLKAYKGFTGLISFDKNGDREGQIFVDYQYNAKGKAALQL